jgi:hypothetical protein
MRAEQLAVVQGWPDTVRTLWRWNRAPWRVLAVWALGSLAVTALLLWATWIVAISSIPDPATYAYPGLTRPATGHDFGFVLFRNGLVLALHSLACVAGFIAGSALPRAAATRSGLSRRVHDQAGHLAIGFVTCATIFSLATQAYALGHGAANLAALLGVSPLRLIATLTPHAVPELFALFLPLAAWSLASRHGRWDELLAATIVTTAIATPLVLLAAAIETWVTPGLLLSLAG